jgi:competence protein ComEA
LSELQVVAIERDWMPSGQRIALGVPLHPDHMSAADWQILPGVGTRLAERIEQDRQENGDFNSLEAVARVSGIGPRRLETWREFFSDRVSP